MCVISPKASLLNATSLNPIERIAFEPKLELELVTDMSPPSSAIKWSAKPTANTDTACITARLDAFTW